MKDIFTTLLDIMNEHVQSEDVKRDIYAEIIERLMISDSDLIDELTKENDLFAEVYQEYMGEQDDES